MAAIQRATSLLEKNALKRTYFFFLFSWKDTIVGHNRWMEDYFIIIGGKRLNTNCRDSNFVLSLSRKKGFLLPFLIVFYFIFLLFDFIAMLLPIHHCPIYCLMMTTCDMKHKCGHYCIQFFFL